MISKENYTEEIFIDLLEKFTGTIFEKAMALGIWFDDAEIKYIETKMMTHKLYRLVNGNVAGIHPYENIRLFDFQRIWLSGFLDDPDIPIGVSAFITYYIGHEWAQMKINDKYYDKKVKKKDKGHSYEDSVRYEFLAQRWPELCR